MSTDAPAPAPEPADGERLVSGEAVELDIRYARVGSRVLALLIDIMVEIALFLLGFITAGVFATAAGADAALQNGLYITLLAVVLVGYPTTLESFAGGRTLGKLALGLRVVRDDGGPIRFRHALTRSLVAVAVEWPGMVLPLATWAASLTTMLANPRGKRLGDLAAGTVVIHEHTPASWGWIPTMPPHLIWWARTLDLTGLDDDLALAVRHFLARNRRIAEPARTRLGYALAADVAAKTTPMAPPGVPGWMYLAAVLAERHRRAAVRLAAARTAAAAIWPGLGVPTPAIWPGVGVPTPAVWPCPGVPTPAVARGWPVPVGSPGAWPAHGRPALRPAAPPDRTGQSRRSGSA